MKQKRILIAGLLGITLIAAVSGAVVGRAETSTIVVKSAGTVDWNAVSQNAVTTSPPSRTAAAPPDNITVAASAGERALPYAQWREPVPGFARAWEAVDGPSAERRDPRPLATRLAEHKAGLDAKDPDATLQLASELGDCAPLLGKYGGIPINEYGPQGEPVRYAQMYNQYLVARLEFCKGVSEGEAKDYRKWFEKAADLGQPMAKTTFFRELYSAIGSKDDVVRDPERVIRMKRKAIDYINELALTCNADAIWLLGSAYKRGWPTEKDELKAATYSLVANRLTPALSPYPEDQIHGEIGVQAQELAERFLSAYCK